jgi:GxxExxY protein
LYFSDLRKTKQVLSPELNRLSGQVIKAAIQVHRVLGPGLLEKVYKACLCAELKHLGIPFECEREVEFVYRDVRIATDLRIDVLVDDKIVVELKTVEAVLAVHRAQLLSYMRLADRPVGLLINFNVEMLKSGVSRILHPNHPEILSSSVPQF